jgi:hypothetical protein
LLLLLLLLLVVVVVVVVIVVVLVEKVKIMMIYKSFIICPSVLEAVNIRVPIEILRDFHIFYTLF